MASKGTSKNVFLFGAGKPDPALGYATLNIGSLRVRLDVVSQDVPGLMGWIFLTVEVSTE